jgi:hypothetical protein
MSIPLSEIITQAKEKEPIIEEEIIEEQKPMKIGKGKNQNLKNQ